MNFLEAAVVGESGDLIEIDVAGFGRAAVRKPPGAHLNGSGITVGARPARMTLLFGEDPGLHRVVAGTGVEASSYGHTTYSSIAIPAAERPTAVSTRHTPGQTARPPCGE